MPTHYKAQLFETQLPWVRIYGRMHVGLRPNAHEILKGLRFYEERDLPAPPAERRLSVEAKLEFERVVAALTKAACASQSIALGTIKATLSRIAKSPPARADWWLPWNIEEVLANYYRRGDEAPGTFSLDILGDKNVASNYIRVEPTPENVVRAAKLALLFLVQLPGRPENAANTIVARELTPIFRQSGEVTRRRHKDDFRVKAGKGYFVYSERGAYYDWLRLVLPPLNAFLRERLLPPANVQSIVRLGDRPVDYLADIAV
jgi:hypothetical protein